MSSIGKITSSLLSMPAELTIAAANLNFDFSLVKVEAPKEFHGVRDALSQVRREKAESGVPHITARKLGALFEPLVPPIPNLLRAYGQRVSEISSRISSETSSASNTGFGIFSSQAGPDATNIWAAATSGKGALAVQLLACMLARIWREPEAISLWVELVERRRIEVNGSTVDGSNVAALMAAQQTFNREQLAAWDSSARSWIKTADAQMRVQQTQLMLIISNIELPVNSSSDLYDSVIKAWTSAMMAMEKLVQGIPQQIRDGSILLAISSWHLYPDMAVLSDVMTRVEQNDPLMSGSLLTFSIHISSTDKESIGVFWSLPMAHMRYYSPPVVAEGRLTSDTSRVSMDEFLIVILGIIISPWVRNFCPDIQRCCRLISRLWNMVKDFPPDSRLPGLDWLVMLSETADRYMNATGILSQQYSKLLSLGIRSQSGFLGKDVPEVPAFGLASFDTIICLIRHDMVEEKIEFSRQVAESLMPNSKDIIIKYTPQKQSDNSENAISSEESDDTDSTEDTELYEYASAVPVRRSTQTRSADGPSFSGVGHRRWVLGKRSESHVVSTIGCLGSFCGCMIAEGPPCICAAFGPFGCSQACHPGSVKCNRTKNIEEFPSIHENAEDCDLRCVVCFNNSQKERIEAPGEELRWYGQEDISHFTKSFTWEHPRRNDDSTLYTFVLGDEDSCGIYKSKNCRLGRKANSPTGEYWATIDEFEAILRLPIITPGPICVTLQYWFKMASIKESLTAMVFASNLYRTLPGATVSLEVLKIPLPTANWSRLALEADKDNPHFPTLFSCLATFESGQFSISPSSLEGVIAMSSYDSIFVVSDLMSDPSEDNIQHPIKRVFGNMGRSEMAFLIPPADPRFKQADPGSWHLINHFSFDGQFIDSFRSTSLHLSLTDFELPLDVGARGLRDRQAVLLESVITVNDKGLDLGDLDILSAFESDLVVRIRSCTHDTNSEQHEDTVDSSAPRTTGRTVQSSQDSLVSYTSLTSLDCWDELLDPPANSKSIFRATGNWQARLAAMATCKQKGYRVRVLPKKPCVQCIASGYGIDDFDVLVA